MGQAKWTRKRRTGKKAIGGIERRGEEYEGRKWERRGPQKAGRHVETKKRKRGRIFAKSRIVVRSPDIKGWGKGRNNGHD